jgi:sulfonate transport system substrate-binding protein
MVFVLAACTPHRDNAPAITLRVADQFNILRSTIESAGEGQPQSYKIEWSSFVGGPAIIAAETGGSVDVGWMAETPMVFAGAAGSPVKIVSVVRPLNEGASMMGLVVGPHAAIARPKDLKGKKIAYMRGTVAQYFLMRTLARAGLSLDDIVSVNVPAGAVATLLTTGSIDGTVTVDPILSTLIDQKRGRLLVIGGGSVIPGYSYLVVPTDSDPKRDAALADFVVRVARAYRWEHQHVADAVPTVSRVYKIPVRIARAVIERNPVHAVPIDAGIIEDQQTEADTFLHAGLIKKHVDVRAQFDPRFNALIAAVK